MHITPALIPPEDFHKGHWLLPVKRPAWYYFMRGAAAHGMIAAKDFMESVDRPLRELVGFLHDRGIGTTPSCSGHHCAERDLSAIHASLEKDAEDIRTGGLVLRDVETAERHVFKDAGYRLPWGREEFLAQMEHYQQHGVLGVRLEKHPGIATCLSRLRIERVRIEMRDGIVFFFTTEAEEAGIREVWARITRAVILVFTSAHLRARLAVSPRVSVR